MFAIYYLCECNQNYNFLANFFEQNVEFFKVKT
jgi:hypothetical protein